MRAEVNSGSLLGFHRDAAQGCDQIGDGSPKAFSLARMLLGRSELALSVVKLPQIYVCLSMPWLLADDTFQGFDGFCDLLCLDVCQAQAIADFNAANPRIALGTCRGGRQNGL